ncbi:hypothetical protein A0256_08680 [Mucilaginibacter sp. PAMC 26640]|nr:hypothetical protein A0256_08680 [Mucilaginibacter sp. PAMC 26640]
MTMVEQTLPSFTVLKVVGENTNNGESELVILRNEGSINKLCKPTGMAFNRSFVPQDDNGGCCKPRGMAFNRSFLPQDDNYGYCKPMCMAFNVSFVPQDDNDGYCKPTGMAFNRAFVPQDDNGRANFALVYRPEGCW